MSCVIFSESIFKAVISTTSGFTAKTISTLHHVHFLNLAKYKNILILDDVADACWCKHDMIQLKLRHEVNLALIQVPPFDIWQDVFRRFRSLPALLQYGPKNDEEFYDLIAANQQTDQLFVRFHKLLESLKTGGDVRKKLDEFAVLISNQRGDILWKLINY